MLIPIGYLLGESEVERVLLIVPIFIVLIVEMLNSAIEAVVDRISMEHHELSGFAEGYCFGCCAFVFNYFSGYVVHYSSLVNLLPKDLECHFFDSIESTNLFLYQ